MRTAIFGLITLICALWACSGQAPSQQPVEVDLQAPLTPDAVYRPGRVELARFTAIADKTANTLRILPSYNPKIHPESLNPVQDPGGVNGNPAPGNVDLVTTSCTNSYPTQPTFSCDVNVVANLSRYYANVYIQVSNATLNGTTTTLYDATNSDPALSTQNDGNLVQAHGLWVYNDSSFNAAALWPVMGPSPYNVATRTWNFANPGNQSVVYTLIAYATEFWGEYQIASSNGDGTYGNMANVDACSGGSQITSGARTSISLPFGFTLWNTYSTTLNICPTVGEVTVGSTACVSALSTPSDLQTTPQSSVASPGFWAYWDRLTYGSATNDKSPFDSSGAAGRVCYKTLGSAPNRMEVVEWRNFDFSSNPDQGSSLDFELFLYEGTNEIDLAYIEMADAAGGSRADCSQCWVGTQGKDGAVSGFSTPLTGSGAYGSGVLGTGTAYTFLPQP